MSTHTPDKEWLTVSFETECGLYTPDCIILICDLLETILALKKRWRFRHDTSTIWAWLSWRKSFSSPLTKRYCHKIQVWHDLFFQGSFWFCSSFVKIIQWVIKFCVIPSSSMNCFFVKALPVGYHFAQIESLRFVKTHFLMKQDRHSLEWAKTEVGKASQEFFSSFPCSHPTLFLSLSLSRLNYYFSVFCTLKRLLPF